MALRTPDPTDQDFAVHNPGDDHYNQQFNQSSVNSQQLSELENDYANSSSSGNPDTGRFASDSSDSASNITKTGEQERNPSQIPGAIQDLAPNFKAASTITAKIPFVKKKGPMALIITILLGGGLGLGAFFGGPSLLLVNIAEVLEQKFDTGFTSLDQRSDRIMANKIGQGVSETTNKTCGPVVSVLCKYTSLSDTEVTGFKQAGIIVDDNAGSTFIRGQTKPSVFKFQGKEIPASEFASELKSNPAFKSAVQSAVKYNAKYAGLSGKIFQLVETRLGISKASPFEDTPNETDADRLTDVENTTKDGVEPEAIHVNEGDTNAECESNPCSTADADRINSAESNVTSAADDLASNGVSEGTAALESADTTVSGALGKTIGVAGYAQTACQAYGTVKAIGYAAKTVRMLQLARYAMIFLTTASMIKAGVATAGDVNYLGNVATTELNVSSTNSDGKVTSTPSSFTDSLAYRNAAFGDTGSLNTLASNYLTAGGLTGALIGITALINKTLGGNVNSTCKTLANPVVAAGSLAAGIALLAIPGVNVLDIAKDAAQGAGAVVFAVATAVLPGMLKDIVAGNLINKGTVGEAAGDAVVSGAGALMSTNAQYSGNAPLTPSQAVAYNDLQNQTVAESAAQDRLATSPFDAADPNTFLGTIFTQLSPYASDLSSLSGLLSAGTSIVTTSFGSIFTPVTKAADSVSNYTTCQDTGYQGLDGGAGVATDLFCNPIRGIPAQYLDAAPSPADLTQQLINSGDIDPTTGDPISPVYTTLVTDCINRTAPLDESSDPSGQDQTASDSSKCFINNQTTANYYIHYIDQRALDQMENGMDDGDTTSTASTTTSTAGTTINQATLYNDSSNVACAAGTTDAGISQGYRGGVEINIRLCSLPNTKDENHGGAPAKVNSVVSGAFLAMTTALATNEKVSTLTVADSYRSMADQQAAFAEYGSPRAAKPGFSNHQMGLAIDFQLATGNDGATKAAGTDAVYDWLKANGATYGMVQLTTEAWHWQPSGADQ